MLERLLPDCIRFAAALEGIKARLATYSEKYDEYRKRERRGYGKQGPGFSHHSGGGHSYSNSREPLPGDAVAAAKLAQALNADSGAMVAIEFQDLDATYRAAARQGQRA